MKRLTFVEGLGFALIASLAGAGLFFALSPWFGWSLLLKLIGTLLAGAYVAFLLIRTSRRSGRISVCCIWIGFALMAWIFVDSAHFLIALHWIVIWFIRSLYFYRSPGPALVDLTLCASGLVVAIGVFRHTGSLALGIWCLFLIQALVAMIPRDFKSPALEHTASDGFDRAHRSAELALRKLI